MFSSCENNNSCRGQFMLDSLSAMVCLLDKNKNIIGFNKAWSEFFKGIGESISEGDNSYNYLDICLNNKLMGEETVQKIKMGIEAVVNEEQDFFECEFTYEFDKERWFVARVTPYLAPKEGSYGREVVIAHEEISDKKKTSENQAKADDFLDNAVELITFQDNDLNIVWANRAAREAFKEKTDELIGKKCYEIAQGRSTPCEDCPVIRAINLGQRCTEEKVTPDGRYFSIIGSPVKNENGEVIGAVETALEITEKKHLEINLEERNKILEGIVNSVDDGLTVQYPDLTREFWNPAAYKIFGLTEDDSVEGEKCYKALGYENECKICASKEVLNTGEAAEVEKYHSHLDLILKCKAHPVYDKKGNVIRIIEHLKDITEQRTWEKKLEEYQNRLKDLTKEYETILENTSDAIFFIEVEEGIVDNTFKFLRNNVQHQKLTGLSMEKIRGKTPYEVLNKKTADFVISNYKHCCQVKETIEYEETLDLPNGKRTYHTSLTPVLENGKVVKIVGSSRDITRRKDMERALKESEEKLRTYIEEAPVGIFVIDENGYHLETNPEGCRLRGASREELKKYKNFDFVHPDYKDKALTNFKRIKEEGRIHVELLGIKFDGTPIWLNILAVKLSGNRIIGFVTDISKQKNTEERLRQSEQFLEGILNSIPDVIGIQRPDHTVVRYNEAGYEFLDMSHEEVSGNKCYQLIGRTTQCKPCATSKALETKNLEQVEKYIPEYDTYLETRANPLLDENGNVHYIIEQLRDITVYKKTLNALKESEQRFRSIIEAAKTVSLIVTDLNSNVVEFSPGAEEIFGYNRNEIIEKHVGMLHTAEDIKKFPALIEKLIKFKEGFTLETELVKKSGKVFPALFSLQPLFDFEGNVSGTLGITVDITELKETEEKLRKSEQKFRSFVEKAFDLIFTVNEKGEITYVSPNCKELLGYEPEEVLGGNYLTGIHPEDYDKTVQHFYNILKKNYIEEEIEGRIYHKDGEWRWFATRAAVIDRSKEETVILGISRDVTERKQFERALRNSNELLNGIFESIQDGMSVLNPDLTIRHTNYIIKSWHESELPLEGKKCYQAFHGLSKPCKDCPTLRCLETGEMENEELTVKTEHGEKWIELYSYPMFEGENNEVSGVVEFIRDITPRKLYEIELDNQKNQFEALFKNTSDAVAQIDHNNSIVDINEKFTELFGYTVEEAAGKQLSELVLKNKNEKNLQKEVLYEGKTAEDEATRYKKDGEPVEVIVKGVPIFIDNEAVGGYAVYTDITQRKKAEERIRYLSFHDSLTGLYNRAYLEKEMERLDTKRQLPVSILMADVNGLKLLNDTFGHDAGDELLMKSADILTKSCRKEDIIARWGGDEFVILLPQTNGSEADVIAERIREESKNYYVHSVPVRIAVGCFTKYNPKESMEEVLNEAEDRMYKNKLMERSSTRQDIVSALLKTLKQKSNETEDHLKRMGELSYEFGRAIGLSEEDLERLYLLATMHDIGKIVISEEILKKSSSLNQEEWTLLKEHPKKGEYIARASENLVHIADEIGAHHERWDGKGYPWGLKQKEIPLLSRIIAIIDTYDVMTNGTYYKNPVSKEEALKEIKNCAGTQFDPELVEEFLKIV
ncbi:PAS domain S-box protein [Natranaerofaba carboxydovora]|uniref:PAS domain S-box protein n=1 Tax=Natranaerofaba carboxydovora TaxID=2742683 RepID=UPI001F13EF05|nr:PAS domain S-box protein [Natranaerofaba carboxydovora]UMZ72519.1 putative diguanylate cyclase YegE [Natranaerofaba carboxydovora]